jgi:Cu/Ag efflux pump CusA
MSGGEPNCHGGTPWSWRDLRNRRHWHLSGAAGRFRQSAPCHSRLPDLAFAAGVWGASPYLGDRVISLGSLVGFPTVLGIAGRNGIMLFCHYQHLQCEVRMVFGPDLVLRGAWERLALLLMTALAIGLALVPLEVLESLFSARAEPCAV